MFFNTTYKVFVAKAAANIMSEMVGQAVQKGLIDLNASYSDNENMYEHLTIQAENAAFALAKHMDSAWQAEGDLQTTFFDVEDTPMTELEKAVYDVSSQLEEIKEAVQKPYSQPGDLSTFQEIAKNLYDIEGHLRVLKDLHVKIDEEDE